MNRSSAAILSFLHLRRVVFAVDLRGSISSEVDSKNDPPFGSISFLRTGKGDHEDELELVPAPEVDTDTAAPPGIIGRYGTSDEGERPTAGLQLRAPNMAARPGIGTATAAPLTGWKKKAAECSQKGGGKKPEEPACTKNGCPDGRSKYEDWEKLGVDKTCARDCKKHGWKEGDDLVCVKMKETKSQMPSDWKMQELSDVSADDLEDCSKPAALPPFPAGSKDTTGCHAKGKYPACTRDPPEMPCGLGVWTEFNNPKIGVDKVCEAQCGAKQGSEYASIKSTAKKWKKGDGVVCLDPPKRDKENKKLCEEMNKKIKKQLEKQGTSNSHKHKKAGASEDGEGTTDQGADVDENNQQNKDNGGKKGGLSGMVIVVIIVGSVLLLCGCGLLLRGSGAGSSGSGAGTVKIRKAGGRR